VASGQRDPGLRGGIWRTLLLTMREGVPAAEVEAFEQELLGMPHYMAAIRNWRLARVTTPGSRWTHVWQQEYAAIDGLVDKLDRQLKKHKEKITDHHRSEGSIAREL